MQLEKTNIPGWYKDPKTGVVLNKNEDQLKAYNAARAHFVEAAELRRKYDNLEAELAQIRALLAAR